MGKKGSWLSTLKGAFASSSKDKPGNERGKKYPAEKRSWGIPKLRHGKEINSFIPRRREPSSVEKILGDADEEQRRKINQAIPRHTEKEEPSEKNYPEPTRDFISQKQKTFQVLKQDHNALRQQQRTRQGIPKDIEREDKHKKMHEVPQKINDREANRKWIQAPPQMTQQLKVTAPKARITHEYLRRSAIKIQAAYRGHMERKNFQALKGLMRLQHVMRGQSVRRQTLNTMRCMQLLVKVQFQIRSMRLQRMEARNSRQNHMLGGKGNKESSISKWGFAQLQPEAEAREEWNDSLLAKEDVDERMRRKMEAVMRRERAFAYAYSNQMLKATPQSAYFVLSQLKPNGIPSWTNWRDRQLPPPPSQPEIYRLISTPRTPVNPQPFEGGGGTPLRPISRSRPPPSTPTPRSRPSGNSSNRWRAAPTAPRDDESLTSCPAYAVPSYMAPTVSAKAKVREALPPAPETGRRFSFGLGQSISSLKWGRDATEKKTTEPSSRGRHRHHRSTHSIGELSIDSAVSLPVGVGRRPFRV